MNLLRNTLSLALCCTVSAAALAGVYSWKDANGKVHYGDQPPTEKQKEARKLAAPPPADAPPSKPGADDEKSKAAEGGKEVAKPQKEDPAEARKRQEGCRQAKTNLAAIESGELRFTINAKGERIGLDGDVRAAEIAKARRNVSDWCSPPKPAPSPAPAAGK